MSLTTPSPTYESPFAVFAGTRRFSVAEYHKMINDDLLTSDDHVELLDGYILYKSDYGPFSGSLAFPEWSDLRKFTPAEYHRLVELGILLPDERVELLDGYVVKKMPHNPPHDSVVQRLTKRLVRTVPDGWGVRCQLSLALSGSVPEPDFVAARGDDRAFDDHHPGPTEVGLVIEVSDSSLARDRKDKHLLYAHDGIPVYWVVNVVDRRIELYTDPQPDADPPAYATRTDYHPGDAVPVVLDGRTVGTLAVADLLP